MKDRRGRWEVGIGTQGGLLEGTRWILCFERNEGLRRGRVGWPGCEDDSPSTSVSVIQRASCRKDSRFS